jgi:hypothetical protein
MIDPRILILAAGTFHHRYRLIAMALMNDIPIPSARNGVVMNTMSQTLSPPSNGSP